MRVHGKYRDVEANSVEAKLSVVFVLRHPPKCSIFHTHKQGQCFNWYKYTESSTRVGTIVDRKKSTETNWSSARIKTVVSLPCMHAIPKTKCTVEIRTTVLIDLLWFNVVHYSSLFQYFSIGPHSSLYLFVENIIMIMIETHGIALLLLVNPRIPHRNIDTVHPTYVFIVWKEDASLPAMFNPLCSSKINNC